MGKRFPGKSDKKAANSGLSPPPSLWKNRLKGSVPPVWIKNRSRDPVDAEPVFVKHKGRSFIQVGTHQSPQQLVPVQFADQAAGAVVGGDIGGILGENVADDLVNGVVALFPQGVVDRGQDLLCLLYTSDAADD